MLETLRSHPELAKDLILGLGLLSFALVGYAIQRSSRFYPPGFGYDDEKRDRLVAIAVGTPGVLFGIAAFAILMITNPT